MNLFHPWEAEMLAIMDWSWQLDGWIVATGVLCAVAASLLGNFLLLRRMSLLGDAISHAILPGLAAAFFLSGSRSSLPMFVGAVLVGILTAVLTEWIRGAGKVDEGASMGVVFTSLFALGLVLIVQAADHVDLDPGCVLYGAIELTPFDQVPIWSASSMGDTGATEKWSLEIPRAVLMLGVVCLLNSVFVFLFFKELKISSFDPALSTTSGFSSRLLHYALMTLVAITSVASFESVGNILVVAMFIVPPATAYLLTDRLGLMIGLSAGIAAISATLGHVNATVIPTWFGYQSTTTAGMMAVTAGAIFGVAFLFSPRYGVLVKMARRQLLAWRILADDVLALLYRIEERQRDKSASIAAMQPILLANLPSLRTVVWLLARSSLIIRNGKDYRLTSAGRDKASDLVRSHRLWEQYLVSRVGLESDRIHDKAERLEHFTSPEMRDQLTEQTSAADIDPHGRPIPPESQPSIPSRNRAT